MNRRRKLQKQLTEETDDEKKKEIKTSVDPSEFLNFYREFSKNSMLGCEDDASRSEIDFRRKRHVQLRVWESVMAHLSS